MTDQPIGVFDSGIGGLTVVKALLERLPHEEIVYFGDTARVPYGTKSKETVIKFSTENIEFLLQCNVKAIVIACNTSSAWALPQIQSYFKVPMLGVIQPGAQAALAASRTRRIGVIGTSATIRSGAYEQALKALDHEIKVTMQSCPLFVPLAEEGWTREPVTLAVARKYLQPLQRARVDTLILGCTHYPLLAPVIQRVMGRSVRLIDSAYATAIATKELLQREGLLAVARDGRANHHFYVSDEPEQFRRVGERFLGHNILHVKRGGVGYEAKVWR